MNRYAIERYNQCDNDKVVNIPNDIPSKRSRFFTWRVKLFLFFFAILSVICMFAYRAYRAHKDVEEVLGQLNQPECVIYTKGGYFVTLELLGKTIQDVPKQNLPIVTETLTAKEALMVMNPISWCEWRSEDRIYPPEVGKYVNKYPRRD